MGFRAEDQKMIRLGVRLPGKTNEIQRENEGPVKVKKETASEPQVVRPERSPCFLEEL